MRVGDIVATKYEERQLEKKAHIREITYLQAECLLLYSKKYKLTLEEAAKLFEQYHILDYISVCYDYLHLSGTEYLVEDIANRIKEGVDFVDRTKK